MTVLLGLLSAISAGTSDFLGGLSSRHAQPIPVTTMSHLGGALVGVVLSLFVAADPVAGDFWWGSIAGVAGAAGLLSIYVGYSRARVAIAAPLAGVGAAALPVVVDALTGDESISTLTAVGIVLGLVAIGLTSMGAADGDGTVGASLVFGLGGAIGLGLLLLGLAQTGDDAGLWPLAAARAAGFAALALVLVVVGASPRLPRRVFPHIVGIAVLGTVANAFFIAATRVGSTAVAAVVTSMFPAVTVIWAWRIFKEHLRPVQIVGIALAVTAVALIAAG